VEKRTGTHAHGNEVVLAETKVRKWYGGGGRQLTPWIVLLPGTGVFRLPREPGPHVKDYAACAGNWTHLGIRSDDVVYPLAQQFLELSVILGRR
jgi:hypothetical protein